MPNFFRQVAALALLMLGTVPDDGAAYQFPIPDIGPSYSLLNFASPRQVLSATEYAALVAAFPHLAEADDVALADLDLDGIDELIVLVTNADRCGRVGCKPSIYERDGAGWKYWTKDLPDGDPIRDGLIAVRDEVEVGVRTLYQNDLFAEVAERRYSIMFPNPHRGPDERLRFGRLYELPEVVQRQLCHGLCPIEDRRELLAAADLDGDGILNWIFSAFLNPPAQRQFDDYLVTVGMIEDGRVVESFEFDDFGALADAKDGLPALYLRDEFTGTDDAPRRTFYSSRNGPRQRVPFQ